METHTHTRTQGLEFSQLVTGLHRGLYGYGINIEQFTNGRSQTERDKNKDLLMGFSVCTWGTL